MLGRGRHHREHSNFFAGIIGQGSWDVGARGVAVGGIANGVSNALAPLMFNEDAVFKDDGTGTGGVVVDTSSTLYCNPQDHKCIPNSDFPTSENSVQLDDGLRHGRRLQREYR